MNRMHVLMVLGALAVAFFLWEGGSGGAVVSDFWQRPWGEQQAIRRECLADANTAIQETKKRLQYATMYGDRKAMSKYSPIAYRLLEIRRRICNEHCDPTLEEPEIGSIMGTLSSGR